MVLTKNPGLDRGAHMATIRSIDPEAALATGVAHDLALSLATLVVGQRLLSESDMPFEPFAAAFGVDRRLTASTFRDALGFEATRTVDVSRRLAFSNRSRLPHRRTATDAPSKYSPHLNWLCGVHSGRCGGRSFAAKVSSRCLSSCLVVLRMGRS
jgi:hypothetical protein